MKTISKIYKLIEQEPLMDIELVQESVRNRIFAHSVI